MQLLCLTLYALSLCLGVEAASFESPKWKSIQRRNSTSPCALVSSSASATLAATPAATPTVDAQLAYDCLNSVPLRQPQASSLLDAILPYLEWQTDTSYLKAPPSGYLEPAVDLPAVFGAIESKLKNGSYSNEYQYQADLFRTFNLAKDGHFRFFADILTGVLRFSRNVGLVSVSLDGSEIPQVYVHGDIIMLESGGYKNFTPSVVTMINGEDAVTVLKSLSQLGALNDPDALYNSMFYSKPFAASTPGWEGYFSGSGRFGFIYPGANTTLSFANGTQVTYQSTSSVIADFSGVTDGDSFYDKFCTGPAPDTSESQATPTAAAVPSSAPGYPPPVVISSDHVVSGYYLNSTENSDVAVLSMLSFEPEIPAEFQYVVQTFLADAKAAGKTKLVIDVSVNGGGYILQGYDTFRQLFPQVTQDGYTRFRRSEALQLIADQFAVAIPANYSPKTASADMINMFESFPNYRYDLNLTDKHFTSVPEKLGPAVYNGDNFTNIIRWDLNDPLTTINSTFGIGMDITGYRSRRNFTQPFAAKDIILLYDGYCASTCTLFSEFMRIQAGIKSISIGGRPSKDAMQTLGGTKGANNAGFDYINYLAQLAYQSGTPEQQAWANWTELTDLTLLPTNRSTGTSLNLRDNILRYNLKDGLPAQFVYEVADCRLFYEPSMITDISNMWEAAASAAWGNKACVQGGLDLKKRTVEGEASASGSKRRGSGRFRAPAHEREMKFSMPDKDMAWRARHGEKIPL